MADLFKIILSLCLHNLTLGETFYSNLTRTHLVENARKACPFNNICLSKDEPGLTGNTNARAGCCTDCSCSESCGLSQNCCFSDLDRYNIVDRSRQECLVPSTFFVDNDSFVTFNMVVDGFPNWNNEFCGNETMPCGQDESATPLGAMYPVFSPATGRIYKNIKCAKCHGFHEENVIKWEAVLMCEYDYLVHFDIAAVFQNIFDGKLPSNCGIRFIYPGTIEDVELERCALSRSRCLYGDSFVIPHDLNMTHAEVRNACMSNFQSLFIGIEQFLKNVFCYICKNVSERDVHPTCDEGMKDLYKATLTDFTTLIGADSINKQTKHDRQEKSDNQNLGNQNLVCRLQQDKQECRRVYCPTGQVAFGNAQCQFIGTKWTKNAFQVYLQLTPRNVTYESLMQPYHLRLSSWGSILYDSPWHEEWEIKAFTYTKTFEPKYDAFVIDYFLVRLVTQQKKKSVRNIIRSIDRSLKSPWKIFLNGSTLLLDQSLAPYTRFNKIQIGTYEPTVVSQLINRAPHFALNITLPLFFDLDSSSLSIALQTGSIAVTRMFYCHQIRLSPTEYQVDIGTKLLYIMRTGRVLFHGEFSLTVDEDGEYVPSICADDDELKDFSRIQTLFSSGSYFRLQSRDILFRTMTIIILYFNL